jgi:hypothetical protein
VVPGEVSRGEYGEGEQGAKASNVVHEFLPGGAQHVISSASAPAGMGELVPQLLPP